MRVLAGEARLAVVGCQLSFNGGKVTGDPAGSIANNISFPVSFRNKVREVLAPGTLLLATREFSYAHTFSKRDFGIVQPEAKKQ